jgi:glycosyltransferase involved in cell wall biosynthesis
LKFKRLLIITDTLITNIDGEWFIFNSVANEINVFNELFQTISIIGVFKSNEQLKDEIKQFERLKIQSEPLFFREILRENPMYLNFFNVISNVYQLVTLVPKFSKIHVRGPGIPMFISLFFCVFFPWKKWWFKFANTWNTNTKSEFWNFQKKLLKSFFWIKVTVNGRNSSDPEHIINFENPTLIRTKPDSILKKNTTSILTFIFAGRLTEEKGVVTAARSIENYLNTQKNLSIKLIIAGNGPEQKILEKIKNSNVFEIQILGAVSKGQLIKKFEESNFLILP